MPSEKPVTSRWRGGAATGALAACLAVATFVLYAPARHHQFLLFDDNQYLTQNPVVRGGLSWSGAAWALSTLEVANWHPLTWLSHMLDVELFGMDAGAHHLVNAALHAVNAGLLLLVLARMTGAVGRSAFVAAVFAVHPLHVESVAWISERKDVLSTLFGLLMLGAYARYAERPRLDRYAPVLLCFALSLLAKPMWVTAPFLLLLLDFWPLRRVEGAVFALGGARVLPRLGPSRLVLEKVPLLAMSAASAAMTVVAQRRGGAFVGLHLDAGERVANAVVSYAWYLAKTFWPSSLAAFYPHRGGSIPHGEIAAAAALLVGVTALAVVRLRRAPWLAVGWCWFLGTLVPVIGLVQVGKQARADRYTYLPMIGVLVAVAWEAAGVARRSRAGPALPLAAAVVVLVLSASTTRQLAPWSDQVSLFERAIAETGDNAPAQLFLAQGLGAQGRHREAVQHAREAVRLDPANARAHKNLGYFLYQVGELEEAITELETAVALDPEYAEAHGNLAVAYGRKGWTDRAMQEMRLELRLRSAAPRRR